jgi:GDPmannose 4,6-dehydratase
VGDVIGVLDRTTAAKNMPPRALITGATGQDGSYLVELLLARDYQVHAQSRRTDSTSLPQHGNLHWHTADICDPVVLHTLMAEVQPNEIYNLASISRPSVSWQIPRETADTNGLLPQQVCELVLKHCPQCRIFQATSSEIFGNSTISPQDEETPCRPQSPYGIAKLYAHNIIGAYRTKYRLHASSGIMFNHESPRRPLPYVSQKIAYAAAAVSIGLRNTRETDERGLPLLKNGIVTLGNIDICRDFGFAGDYVEAMYAMLQCDTADDYVIGTGQSHSIRAFCEAAFRHVGCNWANHVTFDHSLFRTIDSHHTVANCAKIAARLGWRPKTTFDELVIMMVDHQIQQLTAMGLNSGVP